MKILLLSFYYKPDLSAGSFRSAALVEALKRKMPEGSTINIVTSLPNRYESFSVEASEIERLESVTIRRIPLPEHKSGILDQSRAFMSFSRRVTRLVADEDYDLVIATSSRLMTAVLAARIAGRKKIPLYLDIRDIFVDTIKDLFPLYLSLTLGPLFGILERFAINRATKVNLVSPGFAQYFTERYPEKDFTFFTNGIDEEFVAASSLSAKSESVEGNPLKVVYAGNIGEGQGLHAILPELAARMSDRVCFRIFGDGGRKHVLQSRLSQIGVVNVEILSPLGRKRLISEYLDADVLFLHLNDHAAFKKVLPSKLFECAALGKPVWAGVAGYAADFIRREVSNAAVFSPCNAEQAEQVFEQLELGITYRGEFIEKYARKTIMENMSIDILALASEK